MFLKGNEDVEGNEDLLSCQGFEVNLRIEKSVNVIELSVCRALSVLTKRVEGPVYIGVEV